ncbi:MAG: NADH-quinone oxidoreductase subunit NuoE [Chloroflexi bacterium]|nr:NADH-quinone oxidoreductase subunit NuoE [Chloroflexota bacterium]
MRREVHVLSDKVKSEIQQLKARYPHPNSALLPALALAQKEHGWLSPEVLEEVAEVMELSPAQVGSVASFYTMFNRRPVGKYLIQVCTNVACSLLGAEHLVEHLKQKLGIGVGETTPDGRFTLLEVECLGSCGTAPVMQINDTYYENLTAEKVDQILAELRSR